MIKRFGIFFIGRIRWGDSREWRKGFMWEGEKAYIYLI